MEDTLRVMENNKVYSVNFAGLNPCFNGRYSQSAYDKVMVLFSNKS